MYNSVSYEFLSIMLLELEFLSTKEIQRLQENSIITQDFFANQNLVHSNVPTIKLFKPFLYSFSAFWNIVSVSAKNSISFSGFKSYT